MKRCDGPGLESRIIIGPPGQVQPAATAAIPAGPQRCPSWISTGPDAPAIVAITATTAAAPVIHQG